MISILKQKNFLSLISGSFISNLGDAMANLFLVWLIYAMTNQPLYIAISLLCLEVPAILFSPLIGRWIDKNIKVITYTSFLSRAIVFLIIPIILYSDKLYIVLFLLFISGTFSPANDILSNILIPKVVNKNELISANSIYYIQFDVALILGPIISGVFLSLHYNSIGFIVNAITFLISLFLFLKLINKLDNEKTNDIEQKVVLKEHSLKNIIKETGVLSLLVNNSLWNLLIWGVYPVVIPIFIKNEIDNNPIIFSVFSSLLSLGIVIGSILISKLKIKSSRKIIDFSIIAHGIVFFIIGTTHNDFFFLLLAFLFGIISVPAMIFSKTYIQENIPEQNQGRIFSLLYAFSTVGYPLGLAISAFIVNIIGVRYAILTLSTILIVTIVFSKITRGAYENFKSLN
ncbi:MFS transporter [Staphylococcus coagulans]|uniref:MFS transporter n=1 Tax=Staphylococcus coagulans TaxID=74706 RepID=UPI0015FAD3DD|nr:MFS transporter [Staphylococcus coagulans]MBA8763660.1 MFS transporter [Staphylococcus coagulans]MBT2809236.1 MFS transporter [Staphylococcus coagulans]MBT2811481.1 MFS transporter [Staphylococcus coagulans]MBT2818221.1 MFS transporter [Staphylococcus coagulans]MBT2820671.1 MFS transporter [Staphylococcus coagulans]